MIVTVKRLLKDRSEPTCSRHQETVAAALTLMIEMNFSQLPVVEEQGYLLGLISEQSISRTLFHKESRPTHRKDEVRLLFPNCRPLHGKARYTPGRCRFD